MCTRFFDLHHGIYSVLVSVPVSRLSTSFWTSFRFWDLRQTRVYSVLWSLLQDLLSIDRLGYILFFDPYYKIYSVPVCKPDGRLHTVPSFEVELSHLQSIPCFKPESIYVGYDTLSPWTLTSTLECLWLDSVLQGILLLFIPMIWTVLQGIKTTTRLCAVQP